MTKKIRIFSIVLIILTTLWLILGISVSVNSEIGRALFIEIFLPMLGAIIGLWVIVYARSIKSWNFFWLWSVILSAVWVGLWFLFD